MRNPGARLTLIPLFGLLVVATLLEAFGYAIDLFQQSTQERHGAVSGTGGENDVRKLEPGKPHRRELAGGQRHTYRIKLAADQFLKAIGSPGAEPAKSRNSGASRRLQRPITRS